ncbi:PolC-type DNA polymerase III [Candidatus Margulisiibacteriota bacterium]
MIDFLKDEEFIRLEKEYSFLKRARETLESKYGELEKLAYTIVDLETTGLNPEQDEIIEVGALKVQNGEVKGIFNKLVSPSKPISPEITKITGITNEMLEGENHIKPVLEEFMGFIDNSILIAHNAEFDMGFLRNNIKKWLDKDLKNEAMCTLMISRDILPGLSNHKLHTIARYFKLAVENRHRAIGDVEITYQVWLKFIELLKKNNILSKKELEKYILQPPPEKKDPS